MRIGRSRNCLFLQTTVEENGGSFDKNADCIDEDECDEGNAVPVNVASIDELKKVLSTELSNDATQHVNLGAKSSL